MSGKAGARIVRRFAFKAKCLLLVATTDRTIPGYLSR